MKARKTFQIQAYLGLRNDDACTAGWVADEATPGETEARLNDENFYGWSNYGKTYKPNACYA